MMMLYGLFCLYVLGMFRSCRQLFLGSFVSCMICQDFGMDIKTMCNLVLHGDKLTRCRNDSAAGQIC